MSAALVEAGAPLSDISRRLYRTKPDAQLRLFGRRPRPPRERRRRADRVVDADRRRPRGDRRPARRTRRASSTSCPRPRRPRSRSCSRRPARGDPGQRPDQARRRRRDRPDRPFGGGGHARAAGATIDVVRRRTPGRRSSPRPPGSSPRSSADVARSSLGPGLDGILVVAKPAGPTSHDVVALVRRLAATKRVGHGGTLDPFASGVLPVFLGHGDAGRRVPPRRPQGVPRDGLLRGVVDDRRPRGRADAAPTGRRPTRAAVEAALPALTGPISQRPPAYSAIKVGGRRAYAMARAGETVELADARGHDPRARPRLVGRHGPRPPDRRRSTCAVRPGRTSGRSPATSARRSGARPTSAR